jgi:hypothetical protein
MLNPIDNYSFQKHVIYIGYIIMINKELHKRSTVPQYKTDAIRLKSFTGDLWHNISVSNKTCDCEQFQISGRCDHLSALGLYRLRPFTPTVRPTFSQALSGLVKSIRIRRVEESVYWLVYLDTFKEKPYRFRTARRLLIGSAEDGHSIPVVTRLIDPGAISRSAHSSNRKTSLMNPA